jgi:Mrp family chromosome partitioning ATPase
LINSRRMTEVVHALRRDSDFVLFDTPSAVAFSDAAILASLVDGVLLVVRAQESPRGSELQVKDLLNKAKANVLGVVLNAAKPETVDSFFYHSRYYHSVLSSGTAERPLQSLPGPDEEAADIQEPDERA